jgi:hypothetical protein
MADRQQMTLDEVDHLLFAASEESTKVVPELVAVQVNGNGNNNENRSL